MYRQPSVPPVGGGNVRSIIEAIARFLRDFCLAVWTEDRNQNEEIERLKKRLSELEGVSADGGGSDQDNA